MDYVNKSPKRNPSKQKQQRAYKIKLFTTILTVGIVTPVIGLNFYNSSTEKQTVAISTQVNDSQTEELVLPNKPKPKYVFPEKLEQGQISFIERDYDTPDSTPHQLRCGAFKLESDAQNLKNKISKLTPMNVSSSGKWYVVTSPYFANKRKAENFKNQIKKNLKIYECVLRQKRN
ncbi:SPOR domain-containing protein [Thalassotalea nanhaiensis]|uniref:SPOR domain-containing protein n=1 Tax=Thalassotalea nanhaiensis TaxID=3065648 RepID=A0ABY9TNF0_9GAMM|nr:SPOR domain-containing protein [Colwelliaceae bacterium SQ345]